MSQELQQQLAAERQKRQAAVALVGQMREYVRNSCVCSYLVKPECPNCKGKIFQVEGRSNLWICCDGCKEPDKSDHGKLWHQHELDLELWRQCVGCDLLALSPADALAQLKQEIRVEVLEEVNEDVIRAYATDNRKINGVLKALEDRINSMKGGA